MSKIARLRLAAIASENISCIAPLYYTAQSLTAYSLTVYSCYCHIVFVTIHLSHCICHIPFVTLHLSHCICRIAFVIVVSQFITYISFKNSSVTDGLTDRRTEGHCHIRIELLSNLKIYRSTVLRVYCITKY